MAICPNCQKSISEGALFCSSCGSKVAQEDKEQPIFCTMCGAKVSNPTARFCSGCGSPLSPPIEQAIDTGVHGHSAQQVSFNDSVQEHAGEIPRIPSKASFVT